jgi:hypothetical protein
MDPPSRERSETKTGIAPVYIGIAKKLLLAQLQKALLQVFLGWR